jgi:hypothetical protein
VSIGEDQSHPVSRQALGGNDFRPGRVLAGAD